MRKFRTLAAPAFLFLSFFICACSDDDFTDNVMPASDPEQIELMFTITMDNSYTATRAATADNDTAWKDTQSRVDAEAAEDNITSMQVLLFVKGDDGSYTYLTAVTQLGLTSSVDTDTKLYTYTYTGYLPLTDGISDGNAFDGRIVILANCSIETSSLSTSAKYTDKSIREAVYEMTRSNRQIDISTSGLPMWGVTSGSWTFNKGEQTDIGNIALLRAMSKIKVALDDDMVGDGYCITGATLRGFSDNRGYIHPTGYGTVDKTEDLTVGDSTFHALTPTDTQDSLYFYTAADGSYAYIYVPEYETPDADAAWIHLYLRRNEESDGTSAAVDGLEKIELKVYSGGQATSDVLDLVRNHIYEFDCSRTVNDTVFVTTTVSDWEAVETSVSWDSDDAVVWLLPSYKSWAYTYNDDGEISSTINVSGITTLITETGISFTSTSGSTQGDAEAVYSMVMFPKWDGDSNESLTYDEVAAASYLFFLQTAESTSESTSKARWKAHLLNANDNGLHLCTGTGLRSSSTYYCTTGVSRDQWYEVGITLSGDVPWEAMATDYRHVKEGILSESAYGFDYDACAITGSIDNVEDSLLALYADLFFTLEGTDKSSVLTINHYNSEYDVGSMFKDTWYPGGTYEKVVTVDGETYTLQPMQWIRIYWFEARIGEYYITPLQRIMDASDTNDQWL